MGELIDLAARREARRLRSGRRPERTHAQFFFDLACPFSYLAAERIERAFDDVVWTPATAPGLHRGHAAAVRHTAEERAAELRFPLVWPERFPAGVSAAMRVAVLAAERGRGGAYVLAATRLAFCGGFDLDDPEILAEAAAAAGIPLEDCLHAAGDFGRDGVAEAIGRKLLAAGADRLPVLRVGRSLLWGEQRVGAAAASVRQASPALARRG